MSRSSKALRDTQSKPKKKGASKGGKTQSVLHALPIPNMDELIGQVTALKGGSRYQAIWYTTQGEKREGVVKRVASLPNPQAIQPGSYVFLRPEQTGDAFSISACLTNSHQLLHLQQMQLWPPELPISAELAGKGEVYFLKTRQPGWNIRDAPQMKAPVVQKKRPGDTIEVAERRKDPKDPDATWLRLCSDTSAGVEHWTVTYPDEGWFPLSDKKRVERGQAAHGADEEDEVGLLDGLEEMDEEGMEEEEDEESETDEEDYQQARQSWQDGDNGTVSVHLHQLTFLPPPYKWGCDLCPTRGSKKARCWRCNKKQCEFDLCGRCYRRYQKRDLRKGEMSGAAASGEQGTLAPLATEQDSKAHVNTTAGNVSVTEGADETCDISEEAQGKTEAGSGLEGTFSDLSVGTEVKSSEATKKKKKKKKKGKKKQGE